MCTHRTVYRGHVQKCVYTFPDVHIRVHPTSRKEQKYPNGYTHTGTSTPRWVHKILPPSLCASMCTHSRLGTAVCTPPRCVQPRDSRLQRRTGSFPGGCEEEVGEGTKRREQAWQSPWAPCSPSIRPHRGCRSGAPWLSVQLASAVGALRLVLAQLDSPGPRPPEDVAAALSFAQLPGRCRRTRPQRAPPPEGEAGRGGHWCVSRVRAALGFRWPCVVSLLPRCHRRGLRVPEGCVGGCW